jgi:hypothetical protein
MIIGRWVQVLLVVVLAGVVVALAHPQLIFSELIFGRGDAFVYFTPLWALRDEALRSGELPLWTGRLFMGAPLLSDPQLGTFYPPNWLTVGLPTPYALKWATWAHLAWAGAGAYLLARRQVGLGRAAALIAALCFGLGGYLTSHADQINQLQGMSWLPWAFLALGYAAHKPARGLLLLAGILGLIGLTGHTQTLFISGVALGLGALTHPLPDGRTAWARVAIYRGRLLIGLAVAAVLSVALAAVQFLPTLELTGLSNRSEGFSARAAMAFSWNPVLAARGILPSYDGQVFGEYVAYLGVAGLGLALLGLTVGDRRRWRWGLLAGAGVFLALGLYNPLYWSLAELPGFNLFRVPARWLALFALGGAMLAGLGAERFWGAVTPATGRLSVRGWGVGWLVPLGVLGVLMLATYISDRGAVEVDGSARPTFTTVAAWLAVLVVLVNLRLLRAGRAPRWLVMVLTITLVGGELVLVGRNMPLNDLVDPAVAFDPRGTARYLDAAGVSGRTLSISRAYFDTYDKDALTRHYTALGMSDRAIHAGLAAAKLREVAAPNLSALDGLRSVDGYGGGILPTVYWSAFSAAIQRPGALRSIDGRLREYMAQPECLGACVPDPRILWLAQVEALILDKTADRFYDDIQFDLSLPVAVTADGEALGWFAQAFAGNQVHVLVNGDPSTLRVEVDGERGTLASSRAVEDGLTLAIFEFPRPRESDSVTIGASVPVVVQAATLVDARTGDFVQAAFNGWRRALSSDVKVYRAVNPPPLAYIASIVRVEMDDWNGSERTIDVLRDPAFDVTRSVVLHAHHALESLGLPAASVGGGAVVVSHSDTRVDMVVNAPRGGVLVLKESYFPGWVATVDGQPVPVYRANINQQAIVLPAGAQRVTFAYDPPWIRPVLALGGLAWGLWGLAVLAVWRLRRTPTG